MSQPPLLPPQITVLERGWLSSNNILHLGQKSAALVDSGYGSHQQQTVQLLRSALDGRELALLLNTHLHSDHCGGNAALQQAYPALRTLTPPGQSQHVANWDETALGYPQIGQECPRFRFDGVLNPGGSIQLGDLAWDILAAPGHDPHSVMLFQAGLGILISADALWQNGFGIVFPELDGELAFIEVADTLDLIESLDVRVVIPGHGPVFSEVGQALQNARRRLDSFVKEPSRHARHAIKALMMFKLMQLGSAPRQEFLAWAGALPHFKQVQRSFFEDASAEDCVNDAMRDLLRTGAMREQGTSLSVAPR